jgi:hypothetical protein
MAIMRIYVDAVLKAKQAAEQRYPIEEIEATIQELYALYQRYMMPNEPTTYEEEEQQKRDRSTFLDLWRQKLRAIRDQITPIFEQYPDPEIEQLISTIAFGINPPVDVELDDKNFRTDVLADMATALYIIKQRES